MHQHVLLWLCTLLLAASTSHGLKVVIEYSFHLPKELGVATPESANCCPYAELPDNVTAGMVPPTIIGIGVQKGGTTTLYAHFRQHKKLYGAKKELHYLDGGGKQSYQNYLKRWSYNRAASNAEQGTVNGTVQRVVRPPAMGGLYEISPSYMFVPFAACKAKIISPNAKFIVFLRDPADRAHSGIAYTTNLMGHRYGRRYEWMHRTFLSLIRQGIAEIAREPKCNFQSGSGQYTYNDCMGCMVRRPNVQRQCGQRPFVTLTDEKGNFNCNFVGKEHVLRGMYGPQLAWWFTLFHPSQFKIISSKNFFKNPLEVMKEIGHFLDLTPAYTKWMIQNSAKKANVGHYRKEDQEMLKLGLAVLKEFYKRPNLELYKLLHETGHLDFEPFEENLKGYDSLDCTDQAVAESGLCGDTKFLSKDSSVRGSSDSLPTAVYTAIFGVSPERPESDSQSVFADIAGNTSPNEEAVQEELPEENAQASLLSPPAPPKAHPADDTAGHKSVVGAFYVSPQAQSPSPALQTSTAVVTEANTAPGATSTASVIQETHAAPETPNTPSAAKESNTVPDTLDTASATKKSDVASKPPKIPAASELELEAHGVIPFEKHSESAERNHGVAEGMVVEEVDLVQHISVMRPSSFRSKLPFDASTTAVHHRDDDASVLMTKMTYADLFIHVLFGVVLLGFLWYGWRSVRTFRR